MKREFKHLAAFMIWFLLAADNFVWTFVNSFYGNTMECIFNKVFTMAFLGVAFLNLHLYIQPEEKS